MYFDESILFRGKDYVLNEHICIHHPTLGEVFDFGEEKYWSIICNLCIAPADIKHQLYDGFGKYFDEVDDFELFCTLYPAFNQLETHIVLGNLNLRAFELETNSETGEFYLIHKETGTIIDRVIYTLIVDFLRKINGIKKNDEKAGNQGTRMAMIEESRMNAEFRESFKSRLVPVISAMINCQESKYNYDTVWNLPIYVFFDSVKRIQKVKNADYMNAALYSGNIDTKKMNRSELNKQLNWMGELD